MVGARSSRRWATRPRARRTSRSRRRSRARRPWARPAASAARRRRPAKGAWDGGQQAGAKGAASAAGMGLLGTPPAWSPAATSCCRRCKASASRHPGTSEGAPRGARGRRRRGRRGERRQRPGRPWPRPSQHGREGRDDGDDRRALQRDDPRPITWMTAGPSTILVGGSHSTMTARRAHDGGRLQRDRRLPEHRSKGPIERVIKGLHEHHHRGVAEELRGGRALYQGRRLRHHPDWRRAHALGIARDVPVWRGAALLVPGGVLIEASEIKVTEGLQAKREGNPHMNLVIIGSGMVSPAGLTPRAHACVLWAGALPPTASPFLRADGEPIHLTYCPWLGARLSMGDRVAAMARAALVDALRPLRDPSAGEAPPLLDLLGSPSSRSRARRRCPASSRAWPTLRERERPGGFMEPQGFFAALCEAEGLLAEGAVVVTVAAVDSHVGQEALADLVENPPSPWGTAPAAPAEGVAALVVTTPVHARRLGLDPLGWFASRNGGGPLERRQRRDRRRRAMTSLLRRLPPLPRRGRAGLGQFSVDALRRRNGSSRWRATPRACTRSTRCGRSTRSSGRGCRHRRHEPRVRARGRRPSGRRTSRCPTATRSSPGPSPATVRGASPR